MAEAALRADIPGADFESLRQVHRQKHQQHSQRTRPTGYVTQSAHAVHVPQRNEHGSNTLPVIQDRGAQWARDAARNDDSYWNSTLIEGDAIAHHRDANNPYYPNYKPNSRTRTPDLVGRAPAPLTAEQRADLEMLRARERDVLGAGEGEMLEKAALKHRKSHKGKERAMTPEPNEEQAAHEGGDGQDLHLANRFHQNLHIGMAHTPEYQAQVLTSTSEDPDLLADWSSLKPIEGTTSVSALSTEFNPFILLPTDRPIYVYLNEEGDRRQVFPYGQVHAQEEEQTHSEETTISSQRIPSPYPVPRPLRTRNAKTQSTPQDNIELLPLSPTWNAVLNKILQNEHIDSSTVERVRGRARTSARRNGDGENSSINAIDVGLVPNFSKPNAAAEWNDRWFAEKRFQGQDKEWLENAYRPPSASTTSTVRNWLQQLKEKYGSDEEGVEEADNPPLNYILNGRGGSSVSTSTTATTYSDPTHTRPSGLATSSEVAAYLLQNPRSHSASPTTLHHQHEKTLATQANLICTLHKKIDRLTRKIAYYEETMVPELVGKFDTVQTWTAEYNEVYVAMEKENEELWAMVDFSRKVLKLCWEREAEVERMVKKIRSRKVERGNMQRLFGVKTKNEGRASMRSPGSSNVSINTKPTARSKSRATSTANSIRTTTSFQGHHDSFYKSVSSNSGAPPSPKPSGATSQPPPAASIAPRLKRSRRSNMSLVFSSSKSDLEALASVTAQNIRVLSEDVDDWAAMEERCWELRGRVERGVVEDA